MQAKRELFARPGTRLFYELGPAVSLRDVFGRHRRDDRGRVALEAFMALPVATMYERLGARTASLARGAEADEARYRAAFGEVVAFVEYFGPLGLEWSRIRLVENPEADRLVDENEQLTIDALGVDAALSRRPEGIGMDVWRVSFAPPGISRPGLVERVRTYSGLPWDERVRLADPRVLNDDLGAWPLGPFPLAHGLLRDVLGLVEALARRDENEIRHALERMPRYPAFWVGSERDDSSLAPDWRATVKGMTPANGWFLPFKEHPTHVDWAGLGWRVLAEHLFYELSETGIGVGLLDGRLKLGWRIGSLVQVIYLQLLEHVQRHPDFGVGHCDGCGAPILRVRRVQRWHSGCAPAGRQRESRAARRLRAQAEGALESGSG